MLLRSLFSTRHERLPCDGAWSFWSWLVKQNCLGFKVNRQALHVSLLGDSFAQYSGFKWLIDLAVVAPEKRVFFLGFQRTKPEGRSFWAGITGWIGSFVKTELCFVGNSYQFCISCLSKHGKNLLKLMLARLIRIRLKKQQKERGKRPRMHLLSRKLRY